MFVCVFLPYPNGRIKKKKTRRELLPGIRSIYSVYPERLLNENFHARVRERERESESERFSASDERENIAVLARTRRCGSFVRILNGNVAGFLWWGEVGKIA